MSENESVTIRNYRRRLRQCEELGEYAMAEHIREILLDEQDHLIALGCRIDPHFYVALERGGDRRAGDWYPELTRQFGNGSNLRQGQRSTDVRARLALKRFQGRVGADQPAGLVDAAEYGPRFRGDASHQLCSSLATADR